MLTTLRIDPDASQDWAWDGTRYAAPGGGVIEPYAHPMTEHAAVTDGTRTAVILRERTRHRPGLRPAPVRVARREARPGHRDGPAVAGRLRPDRDRAAQAVRVTAGAARTTPLVPGALRTVLHGSWDMGGLAIRGRPQPQGGHPDARLPPPLQLRDRVHGHLAAYRTGHRHFRRRPVHPLPRPRTARRPARTRHDADVLTAFAEAIDAALGLRPLDPATTTFHLTAASIPGRSRPAPPAATLASEHRHPGHHRPGREHQLRRRGEFLSRVSFGPCDVQVDTAGRLMFGPDCDRTLGGLVSPYDEPLYEHMTELNARIAALGARTVVSGLGGDEMVAVGSGPIRQAALDKIENFDLPWLGPLARAALRYGDDQIAPPGHRRRDHAAGRRVCRPAAAARRAVAGPSVRRASPGHPSGSAPSTGGS